MFFFCTYSSRQDFPNTISAVVGERNPYTVGVQQSVESQTHETVNRYNLGNLKIPNQTEESFFFHLGARGDRCSWILDICMLDVGCFYRHLAIAIVIGM